MQQTIFDEAGNSAKQNVKIITQWLEGIKVEIMDLAYIDAIKSMDWSQQQSVLKEILEQEKKQHIETLYVADTSGNYRITSSLREKIAKVPGPE